jgi:hypothetical protein
VKVTVNQLDPDYTPLHNYVEFVLCNGEKVRHCVKADEEKGEVWCYSVDDKGNRLPPVGDAYSITVLRGKVQIHFCLNTIIPPEAFKKLNEARRLS